MVAYSPFRIMSRCPAVMFIDLYRCFLTNNYVRTSHVLRKPRFFVTIKSMAQKYSASSGLVVWNRIRFTTIFDCCVSRGTSHIPVSF